MNAVIPIVAAYTFILPDHKDLWNAEAVIQILQDLSVYVVDLFHVIHELGFSLVVIQNICELPSLALTAKIR